MSSPFACLELSLFTDSDSSGGLSDANAHAWTQTPTWSHHFNRETCSECWFSSETWCSSLRKTTRPSAQPQTATEKHRCHCLCKDCACTVHVCMCLFSVAQECGSCFCLSCPWTVCPSPTISGGLFSNCNSAPISSKPVPVTTCHVTLWTWATPLLHHLKH